MKYTQIPATAFKNIQLNAGIVLESFVPATGVVGRILGATSGGINFTDSIDYKDFGEDIDNCPKNMLELKKVDKHEVKMSGTFVTIDAKTAKMLIGSADVDSLDSTHIVPRNDILTTDFKDVWWVGDYSDVNTGDTAGFVAIHLMNALNTGGFQIQTTDKEKSKFAFEFTGHYSMAAQDVVPYEVYVKQGGNLASTIVVSAEAGSTILFDTPVREMQANVNVTSDEIVGTLHFIEGGLSPSGYLAGDGNFLALKFDAPSWNAFASVKVGLDPSVSSGLVEILNDPDKNGVFKISANTQVFKVVVETLDGETAETEYSLENLVLETE